MLEEDKARISAIHQAIGGIETPHSRNRKLPYYFDANGRYESKETLLRLIEHIRRIGAFDQGALIEEPFPEEYETRVLDIPVRLAADESAHTDQDAIRRWLEMTRHHPCHGSGGDPVGPAGDGRAAVRLKTAKNPGCVKVDWQLSCISCLSATLTSTRTSDLHPGCGSACGFGGGRLHWPG